MSFDSLGLDRRLLDAVSSLGFDQPTPIQTDSIPPALAGRDILACAATGSGKSAAFLLPTIQHLLGGPRGKVRTLILTPTRELAAQIDVHRKELTRNCDVTGAAVYGGVGMRPQEQALRRGVDILVATPGRLLDHIQRGNARLEAVEILILDEADRMLDMGFLPDVRRILSKLPKKRQTLMFSATMPRQIGGLASETMVDPVTVNLGRRAEPASGITQAAWPVAQEIKTTLLLELLQRGELENALVFTRTKHRANRVADWLGKRGISAARIHGNRSQGQRTEALDGFKKGRYRVLVATDVAARGIDIEALPHVVNFDVPAQPEDYIHRVGRTARAELKGDAWSFVSPAEEGSIRAIERAIGKKITRRQLEGFDYKKKTGEKLEIPIAERIAAIRARKKGERQRTAAKKANGAPASRPANHRTKKATGQKPGAKAAHSGRPQADSSDGARRPTAQPGGGRGGGRQGRGRRGGPAHRPSANGKPWWLQEDA